MRLFPLEEESPLSSLYGSKAKLDFILTYLKENPNQCYHGEMFDMSQSKVSEWVSYLLPVLEASLIKMKVMPQSGYCYQQTDKEVDYLLVDVTERQVVILNFHLFWFLDNIKINPFGKYPNGCWSY